MKITEARPGDPPVLVGTSNRARGLLSWKPQRGALDLQVQDAWNWMQTHQAFA
jgi:UDP-glucose 4-epimerase